MVHVAVAPALIVLGVLGALDAAYFLLVEAGRVRPDARWVPPVCRLDATTCSRLVDSPFARLLGVPNSAYGLAWYALVVAVGVTWLAMGRILGCPWILLPASLALAYSAYLAWALVARVRVLCVLCILAQSINGALFGLLLWACLAL